VARARRPATGWAALTDAERRVAQLVADGLGNREVAGRLYLSRYTVETHLKHVFAKLGVSSRAKLAALAPRNT
jgi:DNA-binding CsgD family transcriptional regulator